MKNVIISTFGSYLLHFYPNLAVPQFHQLARPRKIITCEVN